MPGMLRDFSRNWLTGGLHLLIGVIAAQAAGDAQVLAEHGRPVLQLHLTDHDSGLAQVAAALSAPQTSTESTA